MINLHDYIPSNHFANDRSERMEIFKQVTAFDGDFGKVIAERESEMHPGSVMCLTTKGIIAIVSSTCPVMITAYLASLEGAWYCFNNNRLPQKIYNRIVKNSEVYRRITGETLFSEHERKKKNCYAA